MRVLAIVVVVNIIVVLERRFKKKEAKNTSSYDTQNLEPKKHRILLNSTKIHTQLLKPCENKWEEIININKYPDRDWENEIAETLNWFRFTRLSSAYGLNEHNQKVYSCRLKKKTKATRNKRTSINFVIYFQKKIT